MFIPHYSEEPCFQIQTYIDNFLQQFLLDQGVVYVCKYYFSYLSYLICDTNRCLKFSKDTYNFTLQHRRESFLALLCGTYQSRLRTLEFLPQEFTTPTHLHSITNTATHFTDLGRMEG